MNRQAEIAPLQSSVVLSTQFPCPPRVQRGCMPPPRRSSLPPLPPKVPTTTRQQTEFQNFNPGPRLPDQSPAFGSFMTPMSPAPSSSFRDFQSAPVAYHNAALPPRPTTSVSSGKGHRRTYSVMEMEVMEMMYPKPVEMPVGVNNPKEGPGEKEFDGEPASFMDDYVTAYMDLDKIFDFSIKDDDVERMSSGSSENNRMSTSLPTNSDVKKRAVPSRKMRRGSVPSSMNNIGIEQGEFTASQMNEIALSEKLKKLVVTDPKYVKRILTNRETARRTHEKRAKHLLKLEEMIHTLKKEAATITANISSVKRTKLGLEEENKQLRIRLREMEERAKRANALTEYYHGETNRLKQKGTGEVIPTMETTTEENMFEHLNQYLDEERGTYNYGFE